MDKLKHKYFIYEKTQAAKVIDFSQISLFGEVESLVTVEVMNDELNNVAYLKLLSLASIKDSVFYPTLQAVDKKLNGNFEKSSKTNWK